MSFSITLYKNNSEDNKIRKNITQISALNGILKEGTSILKPTILIEANVSALKGCNYFYIPEFGRYYYITDIISSRNNLVQISGRCDVLMSFANEILANSAIIKKQETDWNLYLDDDTFKVYSNNQIVTKLFPAGFNTQKFVLAVAGN